MNDDHSPHDLPTEVWAEMSETERLAYLVAAGEPVPPAVTQAALGAFPGQQSKSAKERLPSEKGGRS